MAANQGVLQKSQPPVCYINCVAGTVLNPADASFPGVLKTSLDEFLIVQRRDLRLREGK